MGYRLIYSTERRRAAAEKAKRELTCPKCGKTMFVAAGPLKTHIRYCGEQANLFWSKVDKLESGCWVHRGVKDKWGYAHICRDGRRKQAHRYAYELTNGPIPAGKILMHTCDNPPCVNPAHLRVGTDADNARDMYAKGRDGSCGAKNTHAILTEAQAQEIIREFRFLTPRVTNAGELAARYGVARDVVYMAGTGRSWKHLHPAENRKERRAYRK